MTRIYVAGPMTGYEDLNYPAFNEAAERLAALGYEALNPVDAEAPSGVAGGQVTAVRVIGVDPGPTPGIVLLRFNDGPFGVCHVVQCTHLIAPEIFRMLLGIDPATPTIVGVERFVIGAKSYRTGSPGAVTRDLVGQLIEVFDEHDSTADGRLGGRFFQRNASQVKAWATDARLDAAGLLAATRGMTHARDAARHALFAAVKDGGIPDPLSKKARA